jgi:hypothetical protein
VSALIVSNCAEEIVGDLSALSSEKRRSFGWGAQRLLWYAKDGDVLVLPAPPDETFLDYVTRHTGTCSSSLVVLVPPPGEHMPEILTPERLAAPEFRAELRAVLAERPVDDIVCNYTDFAIADLAAAVGVENALPGCRFSAEGGDALVNSKAVFRAVAAAAGVPIAPGTVTGHRQHATATITGLLAQGDHVMVKKEYAAGGFGNVILSPVPGVRAAGAQQVLVLPDGPAVAGYLAEQWSWLTGGRADRLVIEQYFPDATTVYAEFLATDDDCPLRGTGEILMEPVAAGEIIPPQSIGPDSLAEVVEMGRRLADRFRLLGYRGNICADAIITAAGQVIFTETNGRLTASTHLHTNIIGRVVGPEHRARRVFLEHAGRLTARSYAAAVERVQASGLGYDPITGTGVLLTANYVPINGTVTYCVVAENAPAARQTERTLTATLAAAPG